MIKCSLFSSKALNVFFLKIAIFSNGGNFFILDSSFSFIFFSFGILDDWQGRSLINGVSVFDSKSRLWHEKVGGHSFNSYDSVLLLLFYKFYIVLIYIIIFYFMIKVL